MPECKNCQKSFNRARDTRLFCSDKCRVYWHRKISVTDVSVTKNSPVVKDDLSVTPKKDKPLIKAKDSVTSVTDSVTKKPSVFDKCPKHGVPKIRCGCKI